MGEIADKVMDADFLVIGGGMAGCVAALKAAEAGLKVVVWEKAGILRSGSASVGVRNLRGLLPPDIPLSEVAEGISGGRGFFGGNARTLKGLMDENLAYAGYGEGWDALKDLERWGIDLRDEKGGYPLSYDSRTGAKTMLYFHGGSELKRKLARRVLKGPIVTLERTMALGLLNSGGKVTGAAGINVRDGGFSICRSKAVLLATGSAMRIYHPREGVPSGRFKMLYNHTGAGDGIAMAFRAGAELVNMELISEGGGGAIVTSSPYDRLGVRTGHLLGDHTKAPIVNALGEKVGAGRMPIEKIIEEEKAGRGPCFIDPTGFGEEVHRRIEAAKADTNKIIAALAAQRGLDSRINKYELISFKGDRLAYPLAGVLIDGRCLTSLKGLYAAGDMMGGTNFGGAFGAIVFGRKAGMAASQDIGTFPEPEIDEGQADLVREEALLPIGRKEGVSPLELELRVRDIVDRYCGAYRSEGKLKQGLWRLSSVKERFLPELKARDYHEVMSAQEARNIILLAEIHMRCALERKESSSGNWRIDYPEKGNDPWRSSIVVRKTGGKIKLLRRVMPSIRMA